MAEDYTNVVQKAYIAYYGRPADTEGLQFWNAQLDAANGNLRSIITAFGNSEEFTSRYGLLSNSDLVDNIYLQLLGRHAESEGLSFYTHLLDTGESSLQQIAVDIMEGSTGDDANTVSNKISIAINFSDNLPPLEDNAFIDWAAASELLSNVNSSIESVLTASEEIQNFNYYGPKVDDNEGIKSDDPSNIDTGFDDYKIDDDYDIKMVGMDSTNDDNYYI